MADCLLNSRSVPPEITENTIQQAMALGNMSGDVVDVQTFEVLFHAVSLDPSFQLPVVFSSPVTLSGFWVC